MTRKLAACVVVMGIAGFPSPSHAQQALSSRISATVTVGNRATVDVDVDDFVVEEGGTAREVFDIHIADYPLVVLIDDSASTENASIRQGGLSIRRTRVGERSIAFGTLSGPFRANFDDEREKVLAEINTGSSDPAARLKPLDALHEAVRRISETGSPFSAMVIVSARPIEPGELESSELLTPIESHVPVHVIAHRPGADPQSNATDVLREVSSLTRGQYTTIYSPASYAIALDRLADRLATEMMIQFLVPPGSKGGEVRVGVKVPGARVTGWACRNRQPVRRARLCEASKERRTRAWIRPRPDRVQCRGLDLLERLVDQPLVVFLRSGCAG